MKRANSDIKPKKIEQDISPMFVAGIAQEYIFGEGAMNASAQWQEFSPWFGRIPGQKEDVSYGLCFELDNNKGIEYVCGVEVSRGSKLPKNFVQKHLPSFTYAVFEHKGHVSSIRQTCDAILKDWIPESGYKKPEGADFFFERYGKEFNPQEGTGDIEIWIPVKE